MVLRHPGRDVAIDARDLLGGEAIAGRRWVCIACDASRPRSPRRCNDDGVCGDVALVERESESDERIEDRERERVLGSAAAARATAASCGTLPIQSIWK